jgi:hypothetical protein
MLCPHRTKPYVTTGTWMLNVFIILFTSFYGRWETTCNILSLTLSCVYTVFIRPASFFEWVSSSLCKCINYFVLYFFLTMLFVIQHSENNHCILVGILFVEGLIIPLLRSWVRDKNLNMPYKNFIMRFIGVVSLSHMKPLAHHLSPMCIYNKKLLTPFSFCCRC